MSTYTSMNSQENVLLKLENSGILFQSTLSDCYQFMLMESFCDFSNLFKYFFFLAGELTCK